MHAGLINGGGFLMTRFAPLYSDHPQLLSFIFVMGTITAFFGTFWKLMQSDIKRMLASSTMGQMGFMIAQCGLGLFPAAIAHLCWHGLFKAYLFLSSGGVAQEKRLDLLYPPKISLFIIALLCGIGGAICFGLIGDTLSIKDTRFFLFVMAMIAGTQFSLTILSDLTFKKIVIASLGTVLMGMFYAMSLHFIEAALSSLDIMRPQPINIFHVISFMLLIASWLIIVFKLNHNSAVRVQEWRLRVYVKMLNASQPHPKTVTTHRNHYQY
jgi:NAD(P)H-quinone oxidoreductase subunit 5